MSRKSDYSTDKLDLLNKLDKCQFVGEIYLTIEELDELASQVNHIDSSEVRQDLILILAVNCAYHFYDDEGFWKHFFDLLCMPNIISNRELYGSIIETRLKKRGLLKRARKGPFRYVGSILEQCAVSKKHIPSFAGAVKELRNRYGWEGVCSIDYQQYLYFVRDLYCSKYLKNFLTDPEGWDFTKQIARLCRIYESGTLTRNDLEQLHGFQPDFWMEFLEVLEESPTNDVRTDCPFFYKPYLFFNPDKLTVGLNSISSVIIDYPATDVWRSPITWLDQIHLFSWLYSGRYTTNDGKVTKWEIKGWIPDGSSALFDVNWRYVHKDHMIAPGTYYLIASSLNRTECNLAEKLGTVNLPIEAKYEAFLITVNDDTIIPGYITANKTSKNITLTWEDEAIFRFPCSVNSYPVFTDRIPGIRVSDFSLISENIVGLLYDCGNGPQMIRTIQQLEAFYHTVRQNAPVRGKIWLEALSRNRYLPLDDNMPELNFALVPKCELIMEPELASSYEKPVLTFNTDVNCEICLDECIQMDNTSSKWSVLCMGNQINGKISFENIDVFLEIPVYRTRLYYKSGQFIDYICPEDIGCENRIIATGMPGQTCTIGIWGGKHVIQAGKFDEKGQCIFSAKLIKSLLDNYSATISEISIIYERYSYRTGAVYIDVNQIKKANINGEWTIESSFSSAAVELLKSCSSLCRSPVKQVQIERIPELPECISDWIYTVFSCASVFDSTEFYVDEELWDPLSMLGDSELRKTLSSCLQYKNGSDPPNNALNISCIPKVDRWLNRMKEFTTWHSVDERLKMFKEWAVEVAEKNPPYRNAISLLNGGQFLSSAWRSYLQGDIGTVPGLLNTVNSESEIINDLKRILESIVMLRFARFERAGVLLGKGVSSTEIEPFCKLLQDVTSIARGGKASTRVIVDESDILIVPLTDLDRNFIKHFGLLAGDIDKAKDYGRNCSDWLFIWVLIMFLDHYDDRIIMANHLLDIQSIIPLSPQRNDIIKKLINIVKEESQWTHSLQK